MTVRFRGTYTSTHALWGLRQQLIPFVALTGILLVVAAALVLVATSIAILVAACAAGVAFFAARSYRSGLALAERRPLAGECAGELSPDGFMMRHGDNEVRRSWAQFVRIQSLRSAILLHNADGTAFILPKDFFASGDWIAAKRVVFGTAAGQSPAVPRSLLYALIALVSVLAGWFVLFSLK